MTGGERLFIEQGSRMCAVIERAINEHSSRPLAELSILDFGCGNGRIALPFFFKHRKPTVCADVDPEVTRYLQATIPGANPTAIGFNPPAPFPDARFDVIYAVSVWTHFNAEHQAAWLSDMRRMLRQGGLALISTASYVALAARRIEVPHIADFSDEDLRREGMIFRRTPPPPGVTGAYGYAAHDPEWVRRSWSVNFAFVETRIGAIEGRQDLHIFRSH